MNPAPDISPVEDPAKTATTLTNEERVSLLLLVERQKTLDLQAEMLRRETGEYCGGLAGKYDAESFDPTTGAITRKAP